jgi:ergothioneine biosynthesis protein EgtB
MITASDIDAAHVGPTGSGSARPAPRAEPAGTGFDAARCADARHLLVALEQARDGIRRLWHAYAAALGADLAVPYAPQLNPPLWELGHIGWFEEFWIARNPLRRRGVTADPDASRGASLLGQADAMYNSSRVAHARRWKLDLPNAQDTWRYVDAVRERTRTLLAGMRDDGDDVLYFFRLALMHELMHTEAWIYMAQALDIDVRGADVALAPPSISATGADDELAFDDTRFMLGRSGGGFAFDNECQAHGVGVTAFRIDRQPLSWSRFLPFVDAGGYEDKQWWTPEGWAWRRQQGLRAPRYLDRAPSDSGRVGWTRRVFGRTEPLDLAATAVNISGHEAQAWCRWAGRRLPTEAQWELAATRADADFVWGSVWEWTASAFAPYPGFVAHPYRDYSQPWFDGRPVLRGASFATPAALRHPRFRNYFTAERNDIFAGLRTCAA